MGELYITQQEKEGFHLTKGDKLDGEIESPEIKAEGASAVTDYSEEKNVGASAADEYTEDEKRFDGAADGLEASDKDYTEEIKDTNSSDSEDDGAKEQVEERTADGAPNDEAKSNYAEDGYESGTSSLFERDIKILFSEFPELRRAACSAVNVERYGELRRLGLSASEAYLASAAPRGASTKSHIRSEVPSGARSPDLGMSSAEMEIARGIFEGLSEVEIKRLWSVVTR